MNPDSLSVALPEVIFHEGPCIVINKPAGLATQAPPGIPSVEQSVRRYIRQCENKPESARIYLGIPHRLDRPVTGALVFGRHLRATQRIADQFAQRTVTKSYWAMVDAQTMNSLPDRGTWCDWLIKVPGKAHVVVGAEGDPDARHAVLHYEKAPLDVLRSALAPSATAPTSHDVPDSCRDPQTSQHAMHAQCPKVAMLQIRLETGRTHQIRVQCAARGVPILGDTQYGSPHLFGPLTDDPRHAAIALHARELGFQHPMTRNPVAITARLPSYWSQLFDAQQGHDGHPE